MNTLPPSNEKGSPVGSETSEPEIPQPAMAVTSKTLWMGAFFNNLNVAISDEPK